MQSVSSSPLGQSLTPSHRDLSKMHLWDPEHLNMLLGHVVFSIRETPELGCPPLNSRKGAVYSPHSCSSDPSAQSSSMSHFKLMSIHLPLAQVNSRPALHSFSVVAIRENLITHLVTLTLCQSTHGMKSLHLTHLYSLLLRHISSSVAHTHQTCIGSNHLNK